MANSTGTIYADKQQPIVEEGSYSGVSQADFTDLDTRYFVYELEVYNAYSTSASTIRMRTSSDNGSTFDATGYTFIQEGNGITFGPTVQGFNGQTNIETNYAGNGGVNTPRLNQTYIIWQPLEADYTNIYIRNWGNTTTPEVWSGFTCGIRASAALVNAFRLYPFAGVLTFDYTLTGWRV
jgi:hypothetical protein